MANYMCPICGQAHINLNPGVDVKCTKCGNIFKAVVATETLSGFQTLVKIAALIFFIGMTIYCFTL